MRIIKCPKCRDDGGGLHFKPARPGTRPYPYVKHYKKRPYCSINKSNILKIEFQDPKLNAWKSILNPEEWHKIPDLSSRHSSIDSYIHRTDLENTYEKFQDIMYRENTWLKKCSVPGKEPIAFTYYGHIVQMPKTPSTIIDLLNLMKEIKKFLEENNDDPYLRSIYNIIAAAHNRSFTIRNRVIRLVPLEEAIQKHSTGTEMKRIITAKQKLRILKMHTPEVLPIFDPKTRDEALAAQFYGTQCPNKKCRSWRTDLVAGGTVLQCMCHACGETGFEVGIRPDCPQCHLPFFDEIIKKMIQNSTEITDDAIISNCIRCGNEIPLPTKRLALIQTVS